MTPLRPVGRLFRYCALGVAVPPLLVLGGLLVASAVGAYEFDLANFSGFREFAGGGGLVEVDGHGVPAAALVGFLVMQLGAMVLTLPLMFGEEWGWPGYLLPALLPMGLRNALLLHGVIWGVWHTPIILLGYNFGRTDLVGVGAMTLMAVLLGVVLGWLRLASGSVWPAVFAHGATNNVAVLLVVMFTGAGAGIDEPNSSLPGGVWLSIGVVTLTAIAAGYFIPAIRNRVRGRV